MPDVTQEGCFTRMALGGFSGAVLGGIYGSCISAWQQAPAVQMSRAQTLARTGGLLGRYGGLFGAVGAAHGMGSCFAEEMTGGKGVVSGAIGGAIAGSILGIPAQSLRFGFGTAAAGAVVCGMADIFDRSLMQKDARAKNKIHPNY